MKKKGEALVFEIVGEKTIIHKVVVQEDGSLVSVKAKKMWIPPKDYKPHIVSFQGKTMLGYYVNQDGQFIKIKESGDTEAVALNPEFAFTLFNTRILSRITASFATLGEKITWAGIGVALALLFVFVILPLAGVPVHVGKGLIKVAVTLPQHALGVPPAGNFTVNATAGP